MEDVDYVQKQTRNLAMSSILHIANAKKCKGHTEYMGNEEWSNFILVFSSSELKLYFFVNQGAIKCQEMVSVPLTDQ